MKFQLFALAILTAMAAATPAINIHIHETSVASLVEKRGP